MNKILVISLLLLSLSLTAAPIGEKRAREIATNFFSSTSATRSGSAPTIELEWAGFGMGQAIPYNNATRTRSADKASDDALMYIYNRTDSEGFVIVAGDDCAKRDIIAFSHDNTFNTEDMTEGAQAILQAWCEDIAASRKSKSSEGRTTFSVTRNTKELLYTTAKWAQGNPYNKQCPMLNDGRAITGCVATAAAIIFYYHRYPDKGIGETEEYSYTKDGSKITIPNHTLGRTFDYDQMLPTYKYVKYTDEQADAISTLMVDIGTAIHINYGVESTSGNITRMAQQMIEHFGYSKNMQYLRRASYEDDEWFDMLRKNLDTYGPTYHRGENSSGGGHAYVLDGYKANDYFHINYGWNGSSNGYYLLPNISYCYDQRAIFNMAPDRDGTTKYKHVLTMDTKTISGVKYTGIHTNATQYKKGDSFQCFIYPVNSGLSSFKGKVCIAHCDKDGNIKKILCLYNLLETSLSTSGYKPTLILKNEVEDGDRLRVMYQGEGETEWVWARRLSEVDTDEVLMCTSAEDLAKSLKIEYDKATKSLSFGSDYATQCSITDSTDAVVVSGKTSATQSTAISLVNLSSGEYNISFAASGTPYTIKLKL